MPQRIPVQYIKLYKRGNRATLNGYAHIIDYVTIRGDKLFVHFEDISGAYPAETVDVEVTQIDFNRDSRYREDGSGQLE